MYCVLCFAWTPFLEARIPMLTYLLLGADNSKALIFFLTVELVEALIILLVCSATTAQGYVSPKVLSVLF